MDHPFRTNRDTLRRAREALRMANDVRVLVSIGPKDRARVLERRENDVEDEAARVVLQRRSFHMAHLFTALQTACEGLTDVSAAHAQEWKAWCTQTESETDGLLRTMDDVVRSLEEQTTRLETEEVDSGSSSYSDYSDSDTSTTEGASDEDEEEEEDEDEDEDD